MLNNFRFTKKLVDCLFKPGFNFFRPYSIENNQRKGVLKVNLMDQNDKVLFTCTIDEAKRYADKNNMILINYDGQNKTTKHKQMQVISKAKVIDVEEMKPSKFKNVLKKNNDVKKFILNDGISDHDLETKIKKIGFYMSRGCTIRLLINGFKMEQKMSILNKIKQKFTPHLALKQVSSNSTQIKLMIVPEKTFAQHYEDIYKKDEKNFISDEDEQELLGDDLDRMIDEKLK